MATERKTRQRLRLINLAAVGPEDKTESPGPTQEIVGIGLSYRVMISELAEIWTIQGVLKDGNPAKEDIGEISLVLLPGEEEPATAVTGYLSPQPPYAMAMSDEKLREELRAILVQLGYDRDGYYLSLGVGGTYLFEQHYRVEE